MQYFALVMKLAYSAHYSQMLRCSKNQTAAMEMLFCQSSHPHHHHHHHHHIPHFQHRLNRLYSSSYYDMQCHDCLHCLRLMWMALVWHWSVRNHHSVSLNSAPNALNSRLNRRHRHRSLGGALRFSWISIDFHIGLIRLNRIPSHL